MKFDTILLDKRIEVQKMMKSPDENESIYIETKFGTFHKGQAVTYSVYPLVKDGLGMVTQDGILTVGQTYMDVIKSEDGSEAFARVCPWDICYSVTPRLANIEMEGETNERD
jgi:hypothetical protein